MNRKSKAIVTTAFLLIAGAVANQSPVSAQTPSPTSPVVTQYDCETETVNFILNQAQLVARFEIDNPPVTLVPEPNQMVLVYSFNWQAVYGDTLREIAIWQVFLKSGVVEPGVRLFVRHGCPTTPPPVPTPTVTIPPPTIVPPVVVVNPTPPVVKPPARISTPPAQSTTNPSPVKLPETL